MKWYQAKVTEVIKQTADTTTLVFDLENEPNWLPGQHILIRVEVDGRTKQKPFSISSAVGQKLSITVKQTAAPEVSKYVNHEVKIGDNIELSEPRGQFVLAASAEHRKTYYFFAAGSGITPIYSMISHILNGENNSQVFLLYGNKNAKHTIFKAEIEQMAIDFDQRFTVKHCHSDASWFDYSPWHSGRIDKEVIAKFVTEHPPYIQNCQYFVCGPYDFVPDTTAALEQIDVPSRCIHSERFSALPVAEETNGKQARLEVANVTDDNEIMVEANQTLLQALLNSGLSVPYSCESGVCGSCQCQLKKGEVNMVNNAALSPEQVNRGLILTCQSYPVSTELIIEYDS